MNNYQIRMYLVNLRQKEGLTQYRVAAKMDVCHQHYNRIENGVIGNAIQFKTLCALSKALNISIKDICEEEANYQKSLNKREEPFGVNK